MSFFEPVYPYLWISGWIFLAIVVGFVVMVLSIQYLDSHLERSRDNGEDKHFEFSFCLGGLCACALFLGYATWQLWSDLGTPFQLVHSLLSLLWVGTLGAGGWLCYEIRDHRLYVREYPRQTT